MLSNGLFSTHQNKAQLVLAALILCFAAALIAPALASAATYTVDSTGDQPDEAPGTGGCKTSLDNCTLRAAIEEANKSTGVADEIVFSSPLFSGAGTSTITLGSSLPMIEGELVINGGSCTTEAGPTGPCVGISGPVADTALEAEGEEVTIEGLAVTGAGTAIEAVAEAVEFVAQKNWIGRGLAGTASANDNGIEIVEAAAEHDPRSLVAKNEIISSIGDIGIEIDGEGADVEGNKLLGGAPAIHLIGAGGASTVQENLIEEAEGSAVLIENDENLVVENEIVSGVGDTGVEDKGELNSVEGNDLFGGVHGFHTSGTGASAFISGNLIEDAEGAGILLETNSNSVGGNEILESGAAGIRVHSANGQAATENRIGSSSAEPLIHGPDENTISGSNGPAIELNTIETDSGAPVANLVFNNIGSGNSGLFIDLKAINPGTEPKGPNNGILPPVISTATKTGASGTAEPESTIRVYRKATVATGEIELFLGRTESDSSGNWSLTYSAPLLGGTPIAATQTPEQDEEFTFLGTSELAFKTTTLLAPTVTGLNPTHGAAAGGNLVTITGTEFNGASGVKFGANAATEVTVVNPTTITAKAPAGSAGTTVDVTVTNPTGTSPTTGTGNDYGYDAPPSCATDPSLCTPSGGGSTGGGGNSTPPPVTSPPSKPKPLTCRKGFKKKKVGGKTKCVKVKKGKKGRR